MRISPYISFTSTLRMSPDIKLTLSSIYSSIIIFLKVTIAFGFLSSATTLMLTFARFEAVNALLISGPLPAPK